MKLVIEHRLDKREIVGPFNLCASREDFEKIRDALDEWLSDDDRSYGWLFVIESAAAPALSTEFFEATVTNRQRSIANTAPQPWSQP
jgi:hypothetical protein